MSGSSKLFPCGRRWYKMSHCHIARRTSKRLYSSRHYVGYKDWIPGEMCEGSNKRWHLHHHNHNCSGEVWPLFTSSSCDAADVIFQGCPHPFCLDSGPYNLYSAFKTFIPAPFSIAWVTFQWFVTAFLPVCQACERNRLEFFIVIRLSIHSPKTKWRLPFWSITDAQSSVVRFDWDRFWQPT